ncbi:MULTISPECIES: hypothetical protein [Caproicibacterium]|uniref:Uncharacterized protein n=1 Tax=Caproicibacterium argilliputei TaxID=3030016 RepID=A0AA97H293_9FIRM|nr:hypothetical protein [Caproicibacterium argilliputei]WOC33376.1 hypothetical protein PXC00_05775 [Caproicibacterium argilliputei]
MKKISKTVVAIMAAGLVTCAASLPVFASQYKNYNMSTSSTTSGPHKYMNNSPTHYQIQYDNTISGANSGRDSAAVSCYKDEWTYATLKPDDQTHLGNGRWYPWWASCEAGDYNLVLTVKASGRTLTATGTIQNF